MERQSNKWEGRVSCKGGGKGKKRREGLKKQQDVALQMEEKTAGEDRE